MAREVRRVARGGGGGEDGKRDGEVLWVVMEKLRDPLA